MKIHNVSDTDIKKWVDNEIAFYDECETVDAAINDMLHDFKTYFLKMDNIIETFDKEADLIEYFKNEWNKHYCH